MTDGEPDLIFTELSAFGREFRYVYPETAAELRTLEDAGIIYCYFADPDGNEKDGWSFTRYKIAFKPSEIFEFVTAHLAHDRFLADRATGHDSGTAISKILDPILRDRVRRYARFAKGVGNTDKDNFVCAASFYTSDLESLVCGGRPDRYERVSVADPVESIRRALASVGTSARRLRNRRANKAPFKMDDEYDVQDLTEVALTSNFDDLVREESTHNRADGSSRVDFCIPSANMIVEIKYIYRSADAKKVAKELRNDIHEYVGHRGCTTLFMYIYDPKGYIADRNSYVREFAGLYTIKGTDIKVEAIVDS